METSLVNRISVKWRLIVSIFLLLFFMALAGTGGLISMTNIYASFSQVYTKNIQPLETLRTINDLYAIDMMRAVDNVLYEETAWDQNLATLEKARQDLADQWAVLSAVQDKSFLSKNQDWLAESRDLEKKTFNAIDQAIRLIKARDINNLDDFQDNVLTPMAGEYREIISHLVQDRMEATAYQYEQVKKEFEFSQKAFFATVIVSTIIGFFVGLKLIKSITEPLARMTGAMKQIMKGDLSSQLANQSQDEFGLLIDGFNQMVDYIGLLVKQIQQAGIKVTSSITELAATTKEQEATANEHAATTSEIAASSAEIAATSSSLLTTMKRINSLAKNTAYATEAGHSGLVKINKIMVSVDEATGIIVDKLSILNEKAANVATVVKTINKVADQTNLLSLNAAIEAEKAGEYGAGFAVVATEIRRLADQTAVATFDIEQMVKDVQSSISSAVMGIDKFAKDVRHSIGEIRESSDTLTGVIEQVEVLMPQVRTMNDGIEGQSLGAKQISDAISQLNEAAQQTAESLSQNSNTVDQLQQAAQGLQAAISQFKLSR